jgi:hypothetical protein
VGVLEQAPSARPPSTIKASLAARALARKVINMDMSPEAARKAGICDRDATCLINVAST